MILTDLVREAACELAAVPRVGGVSLLSLSPGGHGGSSGT